MIGKTLFAGGRELSCGLHLFPLSAGRVAVLNERENVLVTGGEGAEAGEWEMFEALFVLCSGPEELAPASLMGAVDWKVRVREFALDLSDETLHEFMAAFNSEMEALAAAQVEPVSTGKGKARKGKRKATPRRG